MKAVHYCCFHKIICHVSCEVFASINIRHVSCNDLFQPFVTFQFVLQMCVHIYAAVSAHNVQVKYSEYTLLDIHVLVRYMCIIAWTALVHCACTSCCLLAQFHMCCLMYARHPIPPCRLVPLPHMCMYILSMFHVYLFPSNQVMDVEAMFSRSAQGHHDIHPVIRSLYDHTNVSGMHTCACVCTLGSVI